MTVHVIILTAAQKDFVVEETKDARYRLSPIERLDGDWSLNATVLDRPQYAPWHEFLSGLPQVVFDTADYPASEEEDE